MAHLTSPLQIFVQFCVVTKLRCCSSNVLYRTHLYRINKYSNVDQATAMDFGYDIAPAN